MEDEGLKTYGIATELDCGSFVNLRLRLMSYSEAEDSANKIRELNPFARVVVVNRGAE